MVFRIANPQISVHNPTAVLGVARVETSESANRETSEPAVRCLRPDVWGCTKAQPTVRGPFPPRLLMMGPVHRRKNARLLITVASAIAVVFAITEGRAQTRPDSASNLVSSSEPMSVAEIDFARDIAPIFAAKCLSCHAETQQGGLQLLDAAQWQRGGESGPPIVPGRPEQSLIMQRVTAAKDSGIRMPPEGSGVSTSQIELLRVWIASGGEWPAEVQLLSPKMAAARHWAFRPVVRPVVPDVGELNSVEGQPMSVRNEIDRFVISRLAQHRLTPAPEAEPLTLLRRASLDLIGLPPSPEEIAAYLIDPPETRYERAVDRLLASPHYGERWARPWLDLCHFADTDGYLTDQKRPVAWRYRSWLIQALNDDLPYDRMTEYQLAGDLVEEPDDSALLATGFLRNTLSNREGGADLEEYRVEQIVDRTQMVGTIWLGLTIGCARCHDHKYDPLSQRQFYELYAILDQADEVNLNFALPGEQEAFTRTYEEYRQKRDEKIAPVLREVEQLQAQWEARMLQAVAHPGVDPIWDRQWEVLGLIWGGELGEGQLEGCNIVRAPVVNRTIDEKDRLLDYFLARGSLINEAKFSELKLSALAAELNELRKTVAWPTRAAVMQEARHRREVHIHARGDFRTPGEQVTPRLPGLPQTATESLFTFMDPSSAASALNRRDLAQWLMSDRNPLTARVAVNRMWQEFFGRGLVDPPDDFGLRGSLPSHPELLDWLAVEFRDRGWSQKAMHRLIVLSATYRQSSDFRADLADVDPHNVLLARQMPLRLSADQIRDASLSVSGLLSRKIGGPSVFPPQPEVVAKEGFSNVWIESQGEDRYRRGIYTWVQRLSPFAQNVTFDAPPTNSICTRRDRSNSPLQALTLLNDPVFAEAADTMARRVLQQSGSDDGRIRLAVEWALSRPATDREVSILLEYLAAQRQEVAALRGSAAGTSPAAGTGPEAGTDPEEIALEGQPAVDRSEQMVWSGLCSVILNLHEFITRD